MIHVGYVREIVRYPVKSMAGVATESAMLGWHGLDGDRCIEPVGQAHRSNHECGHAIGNLVEHLPLRAVQVRGEVGLGAGG